jgi:hypothetical protein
VLDLNSHKGEAGYMEESAVGIRPLQRKNITTLNGTVRGFEIGIFHQKSLAARVLLNSIPG